MTPLMVFRLVAFLLVVFVALWLYWLPRVSRPELFFGVTVAAETRRNPAARALVRTYRHRVLLTGLVALGWWAIARSAWAALVAFLIELCGGCWAYVSAHRRARAWAAEPSSLRPAELRPRRLQLPGGLLLQLLPFLLLAICGAVLSLHGSRLPKRWPVHWNAAGEPDRWATRSLPGVFSALVVGLLTCGLLAATAVAISEASPRVHLRGPAAVAERIRRKRVLWLILFSEFILAGLFSWIALLPLRTRPVATPPAAVPLVVVALLLAAVFWFARPVPVADSHAEGAPVGDRTADRYWKLGIFYINRDDPSLLIEKRWGYGYTVNLGNPYAQLLLVGLLVVVACVVWLAASG